ncbi:MAG TPA: nitrogenase iron protein [Elusimicrobia bacterium]|nr:nitrogenase iron protein [Elusimicrobiota bacterium]
MRTGPMTLVVYGKGGVGKSTMCAHLAMCFAREGRKVLLLGCDPKADTSLRLLGGKRPPTIVDMVTGLKGYRFQELAVRSRPGLDILETGGPQPGQGCGGRSVATLCQYLEEHARELSGYDTLIFDVLGDLVCGGFVAPLRFGFGRDVYIVSSEETASLFAANNIVRVAAEPYLQGVSVGGIIFNLRQNDARREVLEAFAARLGVPIAAVMLRDPAILDAEEDGVTVFDHKPGKRAAGRFAALAASIAARRGAVPGAKVRPMSSEEFQSFVRENRVSRPGPVCAGKKRNRA